MHASGKWNASASRSPAAEHHPLPQAARTSSSTGCPRVLLALHPRREGDLRRRHRGQVGLLRRKRAPAPGRGQSHPRQRCLTSSSTTKPRDGSSSWRPSPSHGPVSPKRHQELKEPVQRVQGRAGLRDRLLSRRELVRYLSQIAWETDVWVADAPSHLIHFNGERFLGPFD